MSNEFEDIGEELEEPIEGEVVSELKQQPGWAKAVAWATIVLGGLYIVNPTAGIFELLPDALPLIGNLDEAAIMFLIFGAMRYLGWTLPAFIEQWTQPRAQLAAPRKPERE
ncbi:MAG: DUF1232 domain-containing protein [Anaerolineae bacterium]|nr:DUF1232 domain-containing protein [Anaerolineae bacterium]